MCAAHYMGWEVSLDGCAVAGILEAGMVALAWGAAL